MRYILFRGKRVDNGEWVYGWYVFRDAEAGFKEQKHYILTHDECGFLWHEIVPETVGQYTGLNDKNGTRIFEGDMAYVPINKESCLAVVTHTDTSFSLFLTGKYPYFAYSIKKCCMAGFLRITGNIHDNPELLN